MLILGISGISAGLLALLTYSLCKTASNYDNLPKWEGNK